MRTSTKSLVLSAAVAALYAVLSYLSGIFGLAYGPIQIRLSEALCVLPFLFPSTAGGLFIGCLISNLLSPYGVVDIICGSAATLIAACLSAKMPNRKLAPLPPVLANGIIIGAMLSWYEIGFTSGFGKLFLINAAWVALGEAVTCYVLGGLLLHTLPKIPFFRTMINAKNGGEQ